MQDLLTSILDIMGLDVGSVSDSDSLATMGIDSMQLVEVSEGIWDQLLRTEGTRS